VLDEAPKALRVDPVKLPQPLDEAPRAHRADPVELPQPVDEASKARRVDPVELPEAAADEGCSAARVPRFRRRMSRRSR